MDLFFFSKVAFELIAVLAHLCSVAAEVCYLGTELDETGRLRVALSPGDPCVCTHLRLGGHNVYASYRQEMPRYIDVGALGAGSAEELRRMYTCVADNPTTEEAKDAITSQATTTPKSTTMVRVLPFDTAMEPVAESSTAEPVKYADCKAVNQAGINIDGVYAIDIGGRAVKVYCYFPDGYIGIQSRFDGSVSFDRTWNEYKDGFGDVSGEFWLGNEILKDLTGVGAWELDIVLENFNGGVVHEKYATFSVTGGDYTLQLGSVSEDGAGDSLSENAGQKFSTKDKDKDDDDGHCGSTFQSGWWFKSCNPKSNLNGMYSQQESVTKYHGIQWSTWGGDEQSLKACAMKIRKTN